MGKIAKTVVLLPMWPLIWLQMGFDLAPYKCNGARGCGLCGTGGGCCRRARAMVNWWRS